MHDYTTAAELLAICDREKISIGELALLREIEISGRSRDEIFAKMKTHFQTMRTSIRCGLEIRTPSPSGLSGGNAAKILEYAQSGNALLGEDLTRLVAYSCAVLETNAQLRRIVATPTAGSAGIVPACLVLLEETRRLSEDKLTHALFGQAGSGLSSPATHSSPERKAVVRRKSEAHPASRRRQSSRHSTARRNAPAQRERSR